MKTKTFDQNLESEFQQLFLDPVHIQRALVEAAVGFNMDYDILTGFVQYQQAKSAVESVINKETSRRSLVQNAILLKTILSQQLQLGSNEIKESKDNSSIKQDLSKLQHEKKLLENKINMLKAEIETWKKKSSNQSTLQKETMTLKTQITKLNNQLNESRNELGKVKQQFVTQKAVLESKLENAKKNIKNLKDKKPIASPSKGPQQASSILSPIKAKPVDKPANHEKLGLKKPLVSNFSTSPFLNKNINKNNTSPSKNPKNPSHLQNDQAFQSPVPLNGQHLLATSTPGANNLISPLKDSKAKRPSSLKNLISPSKPSTNATNGSKSKKKPSLFDDDDDDDDDLFGNSIRKLDNKASKSNEKENETTTNKENESETHNEELPKRGGRKKRKIGPKAIVEEEDDDEEPKFSPLKKVKLLDKLGGISPLKQRNQERNLFKV